MARFRGTEVTGKGKSCKITGGAGTAASTAGTRTFIDDVKECARICHSHFFDADTMRFFNSRVSEDAYHDGRGGAYFTTSEKGPDGRRAYSVRHYDAERCSIRTIGKFQGYRTGAQAKAQARVMSVSLPTTSFGRRRRRR